MSHETARFVANDGADICGSSVSVARVDERRGMWHLLQLKLEALPPAREFFSRALELDPMLAAAHTELAIPLIQERFGLHTLRPPLSPAASE